MKSEFVWLCVYCSFLGRFEWILQGKLRAAVPPDSHKHREQRTERHQNQILGRLPGRSPGLHPGYRREERLPNALPEAPAQELHAWQTWRHRRLRGVSNHRMPCRTRPSKQHGFSNILKKQHSRSPKHEEAAEGRWGRAKNGMKINST